MLRDKHSNTDLNLDHQVEKEILLIQQLLTLLQSVQFHSGNILWNNEDLSPSLVVSRTLWLILFCKIWLFLNFVKYAFKKILKF